MAIEIKGLLPVDPEAATELAVAKLKNVHKKLWLQMVGQRFLNVILKRGGNIPNAGRVARRKMGKSS